MADDKAQFVLGLVGYGEIGSTIGAGLRRAGLETVLAYDICASDGPYAELIQSRAHEAGVALVRSAAELAAVADLIVGVTPGSASLDSAAAFATCLTRKNTFVDFASATPKIKVGVAELLAPTGAAVGDASIEGTPRNGHAMPILSSGPAGERVRDLLNPWGMNLTFVGDELGRASSIKILRSVLIKGIEALTDEMMLAARHYGVDEMVLASACKTLGRPWIDTVEALIPSGVIHAKRRSEELDMSAQAVADAGVEPVMARAVAARLRWKADLGLKDQLKGVEPPDHKAAFDLIAGAMRSA